jgi:hypothetical protein
MRAIDLPYTSGDWRALLHQVRWRYHKWDIYVAGRHTLPPEALVLTAAEHAEVVAIAERLSRVIDIAARRVAAAPHLLAQLDIPPVLYPLLRRAAEAPLQLARYDLHPTPEGWMVPEFNEDVPGGFNEAVGIADQLRVPGYTLPNLLRRAVTDAFAPYRRVAMLFATGYSEDLQHCHIIEDWLTEAGHSVVRGSPAHLARGWRHFTVHGGRVDAAFRYYPGEWLPRLPNLGLWLERGDRLPMLNPISALIRQSKRLYALWPELLEADDLAFIRRHTPHTRAFAPEEQLPELRAYPDRWVLKQSFGRMGDSVYIGSLMKPEDWAKLLTEAANKPQGWLVQRRFVHEPTAFPGGPRYAAVGPYVVNGRFAGYYSRAAPQPLLTHEALHVATLIEAP